MQEPGAWDMLMPLINDWHGVWRQGEQGGTLSACHQIHLFLSNSWLFLVKRQELEWQSLQNWLTRQLPCPLRNSHKEVGLIGDSSVFSAAFVSGRGGGCRTAGLHGDCCPKWLVHTNEGHQIGDLVYKEVKPKKTDTFEAFLLVYFISFYIHNSSAIHELILFTIL